MGDLAASGGRAGARGGGTAAASLAASQKVKCVHHSFGRAPPGATRLLTEMISDDLKRDFAVRCEAEEQPKCTNCVVFSLRTMMAMQLAVRGYDQKGLREPRISKRVRAKSRGSCLR